jgi:predicted dehydrogenase
MLTVAYIGNGKSTNRYHLPYVLVNPHFSVKTIYARTDESPWDRIPGVEYVTDLDLVWDDPTIDLVVVCTPSDTHAQYARSALEHGKNVLVEKPFAESADEARALFVLAAERGLFLQCYQNRRFDSDVLTVQKVINSGVLGDLLEVESHYDYYRPEVPTTLVPTFSTNHAFLLGHGTHTVDQMLGIFGTPERIHYDVRQLLGAGRLNDYFDLDFYYGTLKVSIKSSYFRIKPRPSFVIYGTKGMFIKESMDRQEEHLKVFYLPGSPGFGIDLPEHYGTLTFYDENGTFHEEKVISEVGDYGRIYEGAYQSIVNGAAKVVEDGDTIQQLDVLATGIHQITGKTATR